MIFPPEIRGWQNRIQPGTAFYTEYESEQTKKWCKLSRGITARRHTTNGSKTRAGCTQCSANLLLTHAVSHLLEYAL